MILLLFFSFISGLVTILAPCIWPLLPIVLSSSLGPARNASQRDAGGGQSKQRPLGITLGIMVSFTLFTLTISTLVRLFNLDVNLLRLLAVGVLALLGLSMVIPKLSTVLEIGISKLSGRFQGPQPKSNDFLGSFITGLSLGIVWSPCAGPILASIAALSSTGQIGGQVILVTLAYVTGVGIPLFLFALGGQKVITQTRFLSQYTSRIQQLFGVLMILTALAIYTNYDKVIQLKLTNLLPSYSQFLTSFESSETISKQISEFSGQNLKLNLAQPAPEIVGINKWLNTDRPLTLNELKGKVVLIDFWTYTCINCIRTLPHVTSWYDKYKDQGFVVIGVHTPEFEFEKDSNNVLAAIKQYNIHYPVAQDNDFKTWRNFNNQYWPAEYLIDHKGIIRRTHFGEGEYTEMEEAIQTLLKEAGQDISSDLDKMPDQTPKTRLSPETYLGSKRMEYKFPEGSLPNGTQTFTLTDNIPVNSFSFGGEWKINDESASPSKGSTLIYHFNADKVFIVLRPGETPGEIKISLDGVVMRTLQVDTDRLYNLVDLKGRPGQHLLKLEFQTPGIQAFAFTFG